MKYLYLILSAILLLCLCPMPYGYYIFVRFVSMVAFGVMSYQLYAKHEALLKRESDFWYKKVAFVPLLLLKNLLVPLLLYIFA